MEVLIKKLNEFTVQSIEILTNKYNESVQQRKEALVLFQYLTTPHCSSTYEELSISDLFEIIIRSKKIYLDSVSLFAFDSDKFLTFTKLIFESELCCQLKNNLVLYIIQYMKVVPSEELKLILFEQWKKNRLACLSCEILESVFREVHLCLEESLLRLVETVCISPVENENMLNHLNRNDIKCIIDLSAKSAVIFQYSLTILHELLILSNIHKNILLLVSVFANAVFKRCKIGILQLFPLEVQELVIILQRDPDLLDCTMKEIVLNRIHDNLKSNQSASTALITYFPKWLAYILGDPSITIEKKHWLIFFKLYKLEIIFKRNK